MAAKKWTDADTRSASWNPISDPALLYFARINIDAAAVRAMVLLHIGRAKDAMQVLISARDHDVPSNTSIPGPQTFIHSSYRAALARLVVPACQIWLAQDRAERCAQELHRLIPALDIAWDESPAIQEFTELQKIAHQQVKQSTNGPQRLAICPRLDTRNHPLRPSAANPIEGGPLDGLFFLIGKPKIESLQQLFER